MKNKFKEFYVYVLMDEKEKEVFFVGRGKNNVNKKRYEKEPQNEIKQKRIEAINNDIDNKLIPITIGRFNTEQEAIAVEETLIHWIYGYENLTNGPFGNANDLVDIRDKNDFRILKGLDLPEDD